MNILGLIYLFFLHPTWFWQVVWHRILNPSNLNNRHNRRHLEYKSRELSLREALQKITRSSNEEIDSVLDESREIELNEVSTNQSIPRRFDASKELAQLCYSAVRLTKPSIIVETGVARGVTTAYILKALNMNQTGHLYSIELPILMPYEWKEIGQLVPESLRQRWTLNFGPGTHKMKKLQENIANIDMFIHDSEHTYSNQLAEYKIASSWLKKGGIIVSDDVDNDALLDISEKLGGMLGLIKQKGKRKPKYLGILRI
jgi:predicted O-methyltransferase YrrM